MRSLEPKILAELATGNKSATDICKAVKPERQQDLWAALASLQQEKKVKPYFVQIGPPSDFLCPIDSGLVLYYKILESERVTTL